MSLQKDGGDKCEVGELSTYTLIYNYVYAHIHDWFKSKPGLQQTN